MIIIPVYNVLVVPNANIYFQTNIFKELTNKDPKLDEKVIFLIKKEDVPRSELTDNGFYPIGVTGTITEINPNGFVVIRSQNRVHIEESAVSSDSSIELTVSRQTEISDLIFEEEQTRLGKLKERIRSFSNGTDWGKFISAHMVYWKSLAEVGTALSLWLPLSNEERYAILEEDSASSRADLIEKAVYEGIEMAKVTNDAQTAQQEEYQNMYKEQAIKKQLD